MGEVSGCGDLYFEGYHGVYIHLGYDSLLLTLQLP